MSMFEIEYYVDGQICTPANHKSLEIEVNFDGDSPNAGVTTNSWRFANKEADIINSKIIAGVNGGVGLYEGVPFLISLKDGTTTVNLDNYLDLSDAGNEYSSYDVNVSSQEKAQIQWLNDVADGFSFEYLYDKGIITDSDFVSIPYIINEIPKSKDIFICVLSTVFIVNELQSVTAQIAGKIPSLGNPFAIDEAIQIAFLIIYVISLIITLIKLINDILDLIIQPVKYHKGMYARVAIEKACQYLGLTFTSTILLKDPFNDMVILPKKFENPEDSVDDRILGFKASSNSQVGYPDGTFGDLLRSMKVMFNGKIMIINGVLHIERKDFVFNNSNYIIPDVRNDYYSYNTDELKSNYLIEFQVDSNDKNTAQEYLGTTYQIVTQPSIVKDNKLKLMKGYENVNIPYALGKRKEKLTGPEKVVDAFFEVVDDVLNAMITVVNAVISVINAIAQAIKLLNKILKFFGAKGNLKVPQIKKIQKVDFGSIINDRIGMLLLENDNVLTPKLILITKAANEKFTKIRSDNRDILSAKYLWNHFHNINSFMPTAAYPNANQWKKITIENCIFTFADFLLVTGNSRIFDSNGNVAKIDSLKWNPWNQSATIKYRVNQKYTNNIIETYYEPKGY